MAVAVNKMDTVDWSKERFDEIVGKLKSFLKKTGFKVQPPHLCQEHVDVVGLERSHRICKHCHGSRGKGRRRGGDHQGERSGFFKPLTAINFYLSLSFSL